MARRGTMCLVVLVLIPVAHARQAFNPERASIEQLSIALDSGEVSSQDLVKYYLNRLERFDRQGPHINALISLNPKALDQAISLDERRSSEPHRSPLYGIPFIAKDNYDTAGIATSAGSAVLAHSIPSANAVIIQRLLDQGAILIGKANMSELATSYGRLGYSSAGGLTKNPYNLARNVSGSSSGSAAAVAADFATFAVGTDTSGSIRGPASVAGLVGLRPTFGLVSRRGVIPASLSFDVVGVLARRVHDVTIVLGAIAGADSQDAATLDQPHNIANLMSATGAGALKNARLGAISNFRRGNLEVDAVEDRTLALLESQGAVVVTVKLPRRFEKLWESVLAPVAEAEFKAGFERYLQTLAPTLPKTLGQFIVASTAQTRSPNPVNPNLVDGLRKAERSPLTDSPLYIHLLSVVIPALREQLKAVIARNKLDALVFSTMSCPASPRFDQVDESYVCTRKDPYQASYVAAVTGFPEVTVPVGQVTGGVPVGFSFAGLPYSEATILAFAMASQLVTPPVSAPRSVFAGSTMTAIE